MEKNNPSFPEKKIKKIKEKKDKPDTK